MPDETGVTPLVDDVLYPFRAYTDVQDFITRVPSASLLIALTGLLLNWQGVSVGVSAAVGALGLANLATEVAIRFLRNSKNVNEGFGTRSRVINTVIYMIIGFGLFYILNQPPQLETGVYQYVIGLGITFLAGMIFMRTYTHLENSGASFRMMLLGSAAATWGILFPSIIFMPEILRLFGEDQAANVVKSGAQVLNNTS